jgi:ABC-type Fe3+-hydroxamate transport system substrate-binding protein
MQNAEFTDQMNRLVSIHYPPKRIISLVPSQTELLFDLGLDEEIVGITKFCIHPADKFKTKTKIGGTKKLDLDLIRSLQPDLIIGNKEENEQDQIEQLMQEFPVWMSDINNLDSALEMISGVGNLTGKKENALQMVQKIKEGFAGLMINSIFKPERFAYFIWKNPYMAAGHNTFINDILKHGGWINAIETGRYPQLNAEDIKSISPERIFLSSEPYPFKDKHLVEFEKICPGAKVSIVDGEMFSWYGSRLLQVPAYLQTLCDDEG